eukprot:scaffold902_cov242-Pinguiococcus_pyrenoidosus.AAC.10
MQRAKALLSHVTALTTSTIPRFPSRRAGRRRGSLARPPSARGSAAFPRRSCRSACHGRRTPWSERQRRARLGQRASPSPSSWPELPPAQQSLRQIPEAPSRTHTDTYLFAENTEAARLPALRVDRRLRPEAEPVPSRCSGP